MATAAREYRSMTSRWGCSHGPQSAGTPQPPCASSSDTVDIVRGNLVPLDDYVLVNAKVGYEPIDGLEVYVRGENLLDEQYQVVFGYGTPGASVYGGFTMQW
jgi:outer membrane receptor protein involved in Fe transport